MLTDYQWLIHYESNILSQAQPLKYVYHLRKIRRRKKKQVAKGSQQATSERIVFISVKIWCGSVQYRSSIATSPLSPLLSLLSGESEPPAVHQITTANNRLVLVK
jgi:hypothetical protein